MGLKNVLLSFILLSASWANAELRLIDATEVEKISSRVWETKASLLLDNPMYELCRNVTSEVLVSGQYIEFAESDALTRRCNAWAKKMASNSIAQKSINICSSDRIVNKREYAYTYTDDEGYKTVYDSKEFECYERAMHLIGMGDEAKACRDRENGNDSQLLPLSKGALQRMIFCNRTELSDHRDREVQSAKRRQKAKKSEVKKDFIEGLTDSVL